MLTYLCIPRINPTWSFIAFFFKAYPTEFNLVVFCWRFLHQYYYKILVCGFPVWIPSSSEILYAIYLFSNDELLSVAYHIIYPENCPTLMEIQKGTTTVENIGQLLKKWEIELDVAQQFSISINSTKNWKQCLK